MISHNKYVQGDESMKLLTLNASTMKIFKRLLVFILLLVSFTSVQSARMLLVRQQASVFHDVRNSLSNSVEQYIFHNVTNSSHTVNYLKDKVVKHKINIFYYSSDHSYEKDKDQMTSIMLFLVLSDSEYFEKYPLNVKMDYNDFLSYSESITNQIENDVFLEIIDVGYEFALASIDKYQGESFSGNVFLTGSSENISAFRNDIQAEENISLLPFNTPNALDRSAISINDIYIVILGNALNSIFLFLLVLLTIYGCYLKRREITIMRLHGYRMIDIFLNLAKFILVPALLVIIPAYLISYSLESSFSFKYITQVFPYYLILFSSFMCIIVILLILFSAIFSSNNLVSVLKGKGEDRGFVTVMTIVKIVVLVFAIGPMTDTIRYIDRIINAISVNSAYQESFKNSYTFDAASESVGFNFLHYSEQIYNLLKDEIDLQMISYSSSDENLEINPYIAHVNSTYIMNQDLFKENGEKIKANDITDNTIIVSKTLKKQMIELTESPSLFCRLFQTEQNSCSNIRIIYTNQESIIKPYFYFHDLPLKKDLVTNYVLKLTDHPPVIINLFFSLNDPSKLEKIDSIINSSLPKDHVRIVNLHNELESNYNEMIGLLFKDVLNLFLYASMVFVVLIGSYYVIYNSIKRDCAIKYSFGIRTRISLIIPFLIQGIVTIITFLIYTQLIIEIELSSIIKVILITIAFDLVSYLLISRNIEKSVVHVIKEGI